MLTSYDRFCESERKADWFEMLKYNCTVGTCGHFLKYMLDNYRPRKGKRPKYNSISQRWRQLNMLFAKANGFRIDTNSENEVQKVPFLETASSLQLLLTELLQFIRNVLKPQYGLDMSLTPKPVLSTTDIRTILDYHWAQDLSVYPEERQRLQVPTAILFGTYMNGGACRWRVIGSNAIKPEGLESVRRRTSRLDR